MVSTRQIKYKFSEGERVLCYEPDRTKAKVLYDSKVLKVIVRRDERSRKTVKYLIHFQGWKTTWDREVPEDYVLKDTEENRKLQQHLSQMNLGAYPCRRDRKKRSYSISDRRSQDDESILQTGGDDSAREETDYLTSTDVDTIDGDHDSSIETDDSLDQALPLHLPPLFKGYVERDFYLINTQNKRVKLPASPTVIDILRSYVRHESLRLGRENQNLTARQRNSPIQAKQFEEKSEEIEFVFARANILKEIVDGIRICFDFYFETQLLYELERDQLEQVISGSLPLTRENDVVKPVLIKTDGELHNQREYTDADYSRRRSLRSHKDVISPEPGPSATNGITKIKVSDSAKSSSSTSSSYTPLSGLTFAFDGSSVLPEISRLIHEMVSWTIVPTSYFEHKPPHMSTIYGAAHLARLFVKLPNLLYAANLGEKENQSRYLSESKMKTLIQHLQNFLTYLESMPEWFSENHYVDTSVR